MLGRRHAARPLDPRAIGASSGACGLLAHRRQPPRGEAPAASKGFNAVLRSVELAGPASGVARLKSRLVVKDAAKADD